MKGKVKGKNSAASKGRRIVYRRKTFAGVCVIIYKNNTKIFLRKEKLRCKSEGKSVKEDVDKKLKEGLSEKKGQKTENISLGQ